MSKKNEPQEIWWRKMPSMDVVYESSNYPKAPILPEAKRFIEYSAYQAHEKQFSWFRYESEIGAMKYEKGIELLQEKLRVAVEALKRINLNCASLAKDDFADWIAEKTEETLQKIEDMK